MGEEYHLRNDVKVVNHVHPPNVSTSALCFSFQDTLMCVRARAQAQHMCVCARASVVCARECVRAHVFAYGHASASCRPEKFIGDGCGAFFHPLWQSLSNHTFHTACVA
jgi:hypothetical protein